MPRIARVAPGGQVYHVLNRAVGRRAIFRSADDYRAFFRVVGLALTRHPTRLLAWCVMPTHWHFVVHPREDGELSRFFGYLTLTHAARWQAAHGEAGYGHVYQGRFKSFMVECDAHLWWVMRYVERNALRAGLVPRAEDWPWGSLCVREAPARGASREGRGRGDGAEVGVGSAAWGPETLAEARGWLSMPPVALPSRWVWQVNRPQTAAEETAVRLSLVRGRPLGHDDWVSSTARRYGLESTLRPRGRPRRPATPGESKRNA